MKFNKRFLLPLSVVGYALPFFINDLTDLISLGLCYFWSSYIILWNFPKISASLNSQPLYIENLNESEYRQYYIYIMNFCSAILIGMVADYSLIKGVMNDKTLIEITAIIGGNLSLLATIQNEIGKVMLEICHFCKERNEIKKPKRKLSIEMNENGIELSEIVAQ